VILRTSEGHRPVQLKSSFMVSNPGLWDSSMMSSLGITQWTTGWGPGTREAALATAAVAAAVRLVSESCGSMIMRTYQGDALDRQPVYDSSQAALFQNPAPGVSIFDFWADTAAAIEVSTAAFVWKVKDKKGVVAQLLPLDPDYFQISGEAHNRTVAGWVEGRLVDVTADVIAIRSWAPKPSADGTSALDLHSPMFDRARKYEGYQGRYFDGDGSFSQVIEGGPAVKEQRDAMIAGWVMNRRKSNVGILWGGAQLKSLAPTLSDSQAVEMATAIAADVARALRIVPAELLYASATPERFPSLDMYRGVFYTFTLMHRIRRIERAFAADDDLFPDKTLWPGFDATQFIRADTLTMAQTAHAMVQTGSLSADEERALVLGLPRIPGGQGERYQVTPVGGVQNPGEAVPPPAGNPQQSLNLNGHHAEEAPV
jgi:HK97 family phage portal protein